MYASINRQRGSSGESQGKGKQEGRARVQDRQANETGPHLARHHKRPTNNVFLDFLD